MAAVPSTGRLSRADARDDREALATRDLYVRYADQIYGYCLRRLGSREDAEDAVQSTYLNAFRDLKRGTVPSTEAAWLFTIAQNVCLSRRRSSWRRGRVESPADFGLVEERTPAPSRRGDELIGLQEVLVGLPESQRRAILLREWQGLSYREIAAELELSQAAVETLIFRARRSLARGLEASPARARRRILRGADAGGLVAALKAVVLGGGAAAKVAATVAIVGATTVVAASPLEHRLAWSPPPAKTAAPAPTAVTAAAAAPVEPAHRAAAADVSPARPVASAPVRTAPRRSAPARAARRPLAEHPRSAATRRTETRAASAPDHGIRAAHAGRPARITRSAPRHEARPPVHVSRSRRASPQPAGPRSHPSTTGPQQRSHAPRGLAGKHGGHGQGRTDRPPTAHGGPQARSGGKHAAGRGKGVSTVDPGAGQRPDHRPAQTHGGRPGAHSRPS